MIPTHFKFKKKKEAKEWGCDTNTWYKIKEISIGTNYFGLSTTSFAWVEVKKDSSNVELKTDFNDNPPLAPTSYIKKVYDKYLKEQRQGLYYTTKHGNVYFNNYKEMDEYNDSLGKPDNFVQEIEKDGNIEEYSV